MYSTPIDTVFPWPELAQQAIDALTTNKIVVISVNTSTHNLRELPRKKIREALLDCMARTFQVSREKIILMARPGQAPRLIWCEFEGGISISHESGLSVAAISLNGNVGIDLMRIDKTLEWQGVTQLYLGKTIYDKIASIAIQDQPSAFAHEWTKHEARLKCCGLALSEWSADREVALNNCQTSSLHLPNGYITSIATTKEFYAQRVPSDIDVE